jgi:phage gp46-like protein
MDTFIDPYTRAYKADPARPGQWMRSPAAGLMNAAYLRLQTPLGSWFGDTTIGSKLHELAREKDLVRAGRLAPQYAKAALQPLLADGRAKTVDVQAVQPGDGRLLLAIELVDARGVRVAFEYPVKVA